MKKLLAVFAHPDDETFGPGGTLAKYAAEGTEIHVLAATRGEAGQLHPKSRVNRNKKIHNIREEELLKSADILGIKKVEFMDFTDGELCNNLYHRLADKIIRYIHKFKPQVIVTFDRLGISGHLDHIAVSLTTTFAYLRTQEPVKLYYLVKHKKLRAKEKRYDNYFIYFPEGYDDDRITTIIDYSKYWNRKKESMWQHQSQLKDVKAILKELKDRPKIDYYILQHYRKVKVEFPESDLFSGIEPIKSGLTANF